ncbi:MAG TPA: DUF1501 domain-containing protein [Gemmataceae bacterium]|nr:DUF1501 domain-containing protein [Gemmataceae bacterium]
MRSLHCLPSRRDLLRAGALGTAGLALPQLLQAKETRDKTSRPLADSCILIFCWGAPSQFETFDPKPDAPDGIRGEFGVCSTRLPGVIFGEHIPMLAERNHRFSLIRTCAQTSTHHQSAAYEALTGYPPARDAVALTATATDHPNLGSVVARFTPGHSALPRFVQLPQLASDVGNLTPGQFAGYLGRQYDPLAIVKDPSLPNFNVAELSLPADVSEARLHDRTALLQIVDQQAKALEQAAESKALNTYQERAVQLLTSPQVKQAFDLAREPAALRERYGRNTLGQSCLLARRLAEAGVKLVTVCSGFNGKIPQDAWDTHKDNFRKLKHLLLPPFDRGVSALIDDLDQRGLSKRTLLIVMGEFGRTPRINKDAGRDHWEHCYTVLLTGGGVQPGLVLGQSDRNGAYPIRGRICSPADLCATIYHCLGMDPKTEMNDQAGKPMLLSRGEVIREFM